MTKTILIPALSICIVGCASERLQVVFVGRFEDQHRIQTSAREHEHEFHSFVVERRASCAWHSGIDAGSGYYSIWRQSNARFNGEF